MYGYGYMYGHVYVHLRLRPHLRVHLIVHVQLWISVKAYVRAQVSQYMRLCMHICICLINSQNMVRVSVYRSYTVTYVTQFSGDCKIVSFVSLFASMRRCIFYFLPSHCSIIFPLLFSSLATGQGP